MQKVLVTGATGFIGPYVIAALQNAGCAVVATSSSELTACTKSWFGSVQYFPLNFGQLDDAVNYQQYFGNPDAVIHLAWEGLPNYKESFHIEENLPRHIAFLNNLVQHGQKNITVTGTCLEYGLQEGCLSEALPAAPVTAYATAKDMLRKQLEQLQQQYAFELKWVRLFYMYGAGQNPNSLLSQLNKALRDGDAVFNMSGGEQVRDYLPVETVAEYLVHIILQRQVTGIINCCSGKGIAVKAFVENYLKENAKMIMLNTGYYPYTDYEPMNFWGDDTKLKKAIIANGF
jgi:nucleoside-diphosphate-sugar epimerase